MRRFLIALVLLLSSCVTTHVPAPPRHPTTVYDSITIEIHPVEGCPPSQRALDIFRDKLAYFGVCRKQNIRFVMQRPSILITSGWTHSQLIFWESRWRRIHDLNYNDRHLNVFVAYVPGHYLVPGHGNTIGLKYNTTSFAIFYRGYSPEYEACVLIHEMGHVLGLVDRECRPGPPVNEDRPSHCNNQRCVMFWQIKGSPDFDALCLRDLRRSAQRQ